MDNAESNCLFSLSQMDTQTSFYFIPTIGPENISPLILSSLKGLTFRQCWKIARGSADGETKTILADMCMEIIQQVSTDILTDVLPLADSYSRRHGKGFIIQEDAIRATLSHLLQKCFADSLGMQDETSVPSEELAQLFGREVTQKVNSALSTANQSPARASKKPMIFISGCSSSYKTLHNLVMHAETMLKKCMIQMKSQCTLLKYWRAESQLGEASTTSIENAQHKAELESYLEPEISETSSRESVTSIALPSCIFSCSSEDTVSEVQSVGPAQLIGNFFDNELPESQDTDLSHQRLKSRYSKFAKGYICRIMQKLETKCYQGHSMGKEIIETIATQYSALDPLNILPGAVPESTLTEAALEFPASISRTTIINDSEEQLVESMHAIADTIEVLAEEMVQQAERELLAQGHTDARALALCKCLEKLISCDELKNIARNLTDNISCLMSGQGHQIPTIPVKETLHDSVVYNGWSGETELFYIVTDDEVLRFLQQSILWFTTESLGKTSRRGRETELLVRATVAPDDQAGQQEDLEDFVSLTSGEEFFSEDGEPEDSGPGEQSPEALASQARSAESESDASATTLLSESGSECNHFVSLVLVRLLCSIFKESKLSLSVIDFDDKLKKLSVRTLQEMNSANIATSSMGCNAEKMHKALYNDLCEEFGSAKALQTSLVSQDPAFNGMVAKAFVNKLQEDISHKADSSKAKRKRHSFACRFWSGLKSLFCMSANTEDGPVDASSCGCLESPSFTEAVSSDSGSSLPHKKHKNKRVGSRVGSFLSKTFTKK